MLNAVATKGFRVIEGPRLGRRLVNALFIPLTVFALHGTSEDAALLVG